MKSIDGKLNSIFGPFFSPLVYEPGVKKGVQLVDSTFEPRCLCTLLHSSPFPSYERL